MTKANRVSISYLVSRYSLRDVDLWLEEHMPINGKGEWYRNQYRWMIGTQHYYFRDERDLTLFLLRWP